MTVRGIAELQTRRRGIALALALIAALLQGCTLLGHGELQNLPDWDTFPQAPKQIVYRFDEHRYIENDPSGAVIGGCRGELYYVDEKLGIRTYFSVNTQGNPGGRFKVDSPYVVVRSDKILKISFDQGRTFAVLASVGYGGDTVVIDTRVYVLNSWLWYVYDFEPLSKRVTPTPGLTYDFVQTVRNTSISPEAAKAIATAKLMEPGPGSAEFICRGDLPWRPSVKREREMQTQQPGRQP